jgi:hypothetical protein
MPRHRLARSAAEPDCREIVLEKELGETWPSR